MNYLTVILILHNVFLHSGGPGVGVPGAPGAAELAAALRRLTPQEINSRRASLTASHVLRTRRYTGTVPHYFPYLPANRTKYLHYKLVL